MDAVPYVPKGFRKDEAPVMVPSSVKYESLDKDYSKVPYNGMLTELMQLMLQRNIDETLSEPDKLILNALREFERGNLAYEALIGLVWSQREYLQGGTQPLSECHLKNVLINEYENRKNNGPARYLPDVRVTFGTKTVTIEKGDDTFEFAAPLNFKMYMTEEEEKTVTRALVNFQHGVIDERVFRAIAANPSVLEAVPAEPYDGKIVSRYSKMDERHRHFGKGECIPVGPEISEAVHHPPHYNQYKDLEVIDITEQLNFNRGNAVKYIARAGFKGEDSEIQDLEKALWYTNRELHRIDNGGADAGTADATNLIIQMNFLRGSAVDRIAHAGTNAESSEREDLLHGVHYIQQEIKRLKTYSED